MNGGQNPLTVFKSKYINLVRWLVKAQDGFSLVEKYYDFIVEDALEDSYRYIEENFVEYPGGLVGTFAIRTAIKYIREARAHKRRGQEEELSGNENPTSPDYDTILILKEFFRSLTKVQQKYWILLSEHSVQEIADMEGINEASVYQMRAKLKKMLKEYLYDEL